ncbi:DUF6631 family protein [Acidihalobacter prosperus]|uniref:Uncharacterized protein n=1 Tax=Acidihalobacter prosperus TaxID=160660 RepID=A0A1A6C8B0_9GAMM|nr:DUF6631 family protein [Acidihalobacter prosperus]OBS10785.1 hypothetical protein Thpro_020501 [Acidihalobacter prosperus]
MTDKTQETQASDNEAEILFPDRQIEIGGEIVTVREFGFKEGMRLAPIAQPIIDSMGAEVEKEAGPSMQALNDALYAHPDQMVQLMAAACDRPVEWIDALSDSDGLDLLWLFWGVNARFFTRRLVLRQAFRKAEQQTAGAGSTPGDRKAPASETSTTP